jgi:Periplasmic copper-binding protein (NosD)
MSLRIVVRTALPLVAALFFSATAHAQLFRAYLSVHGNDANPCTVALPCRLLPAALAAVNDGGEVWILDSANFNTVEVEITKSVTILAIPGALGSVVATAGVNGINIDAANVRVTLRNLVFVSLNTSANGIEFAQGHELNVEDCEISNTGGAGTDVAAAGSAVVTVKNSVLRDNFNYGFAAAGLSTSALDKVQIVGSGIGIKIRDGALATVSNSALAGNTFGGQSSSISGLTSLVIKNSVIDGSVNALITVTLPGASAVISSDGNMFTNISGVTFSFLNEGGEGTIFTRLNNSLVNVGSISNGSLSTFPGI